jgi:hypothetical protein
MDNYRKSVYYLWNYNEKSLLRPRFFPDISNKEWLQHLKKPSVCTGMLNQENQR